MQKARFQGRPDLQLQFQKVQILYLHKNFFRRQFLQLERQLLRLI